MLSFRTGCAHGKGGVGQALSLLSFVHFDCIHLPILGDWSSYVYHRLPPFSQERLPLYHVDGKDEEDRHSADSAYKAQKRRGCSDKTALSLHFGYAAGLAPLAPLACSSMPC